MLFRDRFDGYVFIDNRGMKSTTFTAKQANLRIFSHMNCPHFAFKQDRSILLSWSLHLFKRLPRKEVRRRMQNVEQLSKVKMFTGIDYVSDVPL